MRVNKMKNEHTTVKGISTTGAIGIVFIVLKLIGVISWSWWWVLSPFWIPFCIGLIIAVAVALHN